MRCTEDVQFANVVGVKFKPPTKAQHRKRLEEGLSRLLRDKSITRTTKRNALEVFDRGGTVTHEMDFEGREVITTQETHVYAVRRKREG